MSDEWTDEEVDAANQDNDRWWDSLSEKEQMAMADAYLKNAREERAALEERTRKGEFTKDELDFAREVVLDNLRSEPKTTADYNPLVEVPEPTDDQILETAQTIRENDEWIEQGRRRYE